MPVQMNFSDSDLETLLSDIESDRAERKESWAGDAPGYLDYRNPHLADAMKVLLSGNLRKVIPSLRKEGLLEYTMPTKPNSRMQKYRLTEKGRKVVEGKRG